jgi:hypothetical protein
MRDYFTCLVLGNLREMNPEINFSKFGAKRSFAGSIDGKLGIISLEFWRKK